MSMHSQNSLSMAILVSACSSVQDATKSDIGDLFFLAEIPLFGIENLQDRVRRSFVCQCGLVCASFDQQSAEFDVTCCGSKLAESVLFSRDDLPQKSNVLHAVASIPLDSCLPRLPFLSPTVLPQHEFDPCDRARR